MHITTRISFIRRLLRDIIGDEDGIHIIFDDGWTLSVQPTVKNILDFEYFPTVDTSPTAQDAALHSVSTSAHSGVTLNAPLLEEYVVVSILYGGAVRLAAYDSAIGARAAYDQIQNGMLLFKGVCIDHK